MLTLYEVEAEEDDVADIVNIGRKREVWLIRRAEVCQKRGRA